MSLAPSVMTGPENQHLLRNPRAVSNFEAYGNVKKMFHRPDSQLSRTLHLTKDMNDQMVEFDFLK